MGSCTLSELRTVGSLLALAQDADEPFVVFDGHDECLVAMSPAVFERILFDTHLLNCQDRETLPI